MFVWQNVETCSAVSEPIPSIVLGFGAFDLDIHIAFEVLVDSSGDFQVASRR